MFDMFIIAFLLSSYDKKQKDTKVLVNLKNQEQRKVLGV
jgi:hypothetical protein